MSTGFAASRKSFIFNKDCPYSTTAGSLIETQKSSPSRPQPSDPFAFPKRRFHRIFKLALTVLRGGGLRRKKVQQ
jgi:hypothetical protein